MQPINFSKPRWAGASVVICVVICLIALIQASPNSHAKLELVVVLIFVRPSCL